jgi:hypothetical protein
MSAYVLVSAMVGDVISGVEAGDPAAPIDIRDYPEALAWALQQGYGPHNPDELVYIQEEDQTCVPAGWRCYHLDTAKTRGEK